MKLTFRGGAHEVGRSCIEVHTHQSYSMLDCGIKLGEDGTELPFLPQNLHELDAVFLSHAHLDHSGALPILEHRGYEGPIFATKATKEITKILLRDAFKIGRLHQDIMPYDENDISKALGFMRRVKIDEQGKIKDLHYKFFRAGHIPGSASVMLKADKRKILYTGDIKYQDTRLMPGADTDYFMEDNDSPVDALITEATYGNREHPNREAEEKRFIRRIQQTVDNNGSVMVPVFALGRAQEIMLLIQENMNKMGCPVYIDGMATKINKIVMENPGSIKDPKKLAKAMSMIKSVRSQQHRKQIMNEQGVFITTSGMLTGGPIISYLKRFHKGSSNSILLTGYQGEHTNGDLLLKRKQVYLDGWRTGVKCHVDQFDFSAHAGLSELKKIAKDSRADTLIVQHGDKAEVDNLAEWGRALDFKVYTPDIGDVIRL